jgi:hypothetical protein
MHLRVGAHLQKSSVCYQDRTIDAQAIRRSQSPACALTMFRTWQGVVWGSTRSARTRPLLGACLRVSQAAWYAFAVHFTSSLPGTFGFCSADTLRPAGLGCSGLPYMSQGRMSGYKAA